jgi:hypothetical protein
MGLILFILAARLQAGVLVGFGVHPAKRVLRSFRV